MAPVIWAPAARDWRPQAGAGGAFMRLACAVLLVLLLAPGCASRQDDSAAILWEEDPIYGCEDTIAVALKAGVDYRAVVDGCFRRDPKAVHTLFWLTVHAGFDAASSEGHAGVLGNVLRRTGDAFFGRCLAAEPADWRQAVQEGLIFAMGREDDDDWTERLRKTYPQTLGDVP